MKKLSFLIAGLMGLALMGCSGNLHDVVPSRVDLSAGGAPGAFNTWNNTTPWTTMDKANGIYTYEFAATDTKMDWKVLCKTGDWNGGAYGGEGTELELKVGGKETLVYDNKTGGGKNVRITGLTKGLKYKITVTATESATVEATVEAAGLPPVPYFLHDEYLVGGIFKLTGKTNAWDFDKTNLLVKPSVDKNTGYVTYIKDIEAIASNGECGINDCDWKNKMMGKGVEVPADDKFYELNGSEGDNFKVKGLTTGKPYRVTIQTHPDKKVFVKFTPIANYKLAVKLVHGTDTTEYYINGTPWGWGGGWPIVNWTDGKPTTAYDTCKTANPNRFCTCSGGGNGSFNDKPAFVGKPGDKVTYEVKVVSCTSVGADPQYDSGNLKFDVVVKEGEIQVTIDIAAKTVTVN